MRDTHMDELSDSLRFQSLEHLDDTSIKLSVLDQIGVPGEVQQGALLGRQGGEEDKLKSETHACQLSNPEREHNVCDISKVFRDATHHRRKLRTLCFLPSTSRNLTNKDRRSIWRQTSKLMSFDC
jgi:hypothetical protein